MIVSRKKADQIVDAARNAFSLPDALVAAHARVLASDVRLLERIEEEIAETEAGLAEVLPQTPTGILTTLPCVGVVRASNYGAALGDPSRFRNAAQVYRPSGMAPRHYESARAQERRHAHQP